MISITRCLQRAKYVAIDSHPMSYEEKKMNSLEQLALLRKKGGIITQLSRSVTTLSNGVPYYFVEFTSVDGANMEFKRMETKQLNFTLKLC